MFFCRRFKRFKSVINTGLSDTINQWENDYHLVEIYDLIDNFLYPGELFIVHFFIQNFIYKILISFAIWICYVICGSISTWTTFCIRY